MNKQNHIISMIAIVIVIAGGAFYGGMQYAGKKAATQVAQNKNGGSFGGQRAGGGQRPAGMQGGGANGGAGDFASGEIISKDDTSATIKTRGGGSKIVFFSDKTSIDKSVSGVAGDLSIGQQITVNGKTGADGSLIAQSIQIRPLQPTKSAQ